MSFPLQFIPALSYKTGARYFGAPRADGRKHAACDLIAPVGTPVLAVDRGWITAGPYPFYHGTFAIEVRHPGFVARYCELRGAAPGLRVGSEVLQGEVIGYVGRMHIESMLHFEMYSGKEVGPLTQRKNPPFQRRGDLLDPTAYLDHWKSYLNMCHANVAI